LTGDSSTCDGCDGVLNSGLARDICRVCGGNGETCAGCDDVPRINPKQDFCTADLVEDKRVCAEGVGTRYNCDCDYKELKDLAACSPGCDGVPGSGKTFDKCGRCGGDGTQCHGCDGVELSGLVYDSMGRCLPQSQHAVGCDGVVNSYKRLDKCGDCGGDGSRCADATIPCNDPAHRPDACGVCRDPEAVVDPDEVTCFGCDGVAFSGKLVDRCGVCDGNGRSCVTKMNCIVTPCEFLQRLDFKFDANSQRQAIWDRCWVYDECGICGGDGNDCIPKQNSVRPEG